MVGVISENALRSIYSLSPDGKDKDPLISTTTTGLSAAGFTVSARTIANLAEGASGANIFSQQFFRFDLTKNNGATGMTSGDTLGHANLVLSIVNHMVDRSSAPAYTGDTTSFVQGPLSVPRLDCELSKSLQPMTLILVNILMAHHGVLLTLGIVFTEHQERM